MVNNERTTDLSDLSKVLSVLNTNKLSYTLYSEIIFEFELALLIEFTEIEYASI